MDGVAEMINFGSHTMAKSGGEWKYVYIHMYATEGQVVTFLVH